jgi:predicted phosphodiesterase
MRIAILADIHGNVLALEAVLADLKHRSVDQFVNLGDCVSGPLWPRETAELLRQLNWPTVRGNHDRWVTDWPPEKHYRGDAFAFQSLDISELAWLRALPSTRELSDGVFACHGRPDDDNAYLLENVEGARLVPARRTEVAERVRAVASRFVLCAHSHIPGAATTGDKMIINPGSVGLPAYEDPSPPAHVSESGSPAARYAVLQLDGDRASFAHIAIPYDHGRTPVALAAARASSVARLRLPFCRPPVFRPRAVTRRHHQRSWFVALQTR